MKRLKLLPKKLKRKSNIILVLIPLIIIALVSGFFLFLNNNRNKSKDIIAPYYDKSVFQKPADIKDLIPASISSTLKSEVRLKLPIIMYHYVEYVANDKDIIRKKLNITPRIFEEQLKAFKDEGFESHFIKEIPAILGSENSNSSKRIFLTFDDGYEDFYTFAFPLLKKYNMKSTIYIVYNFIGRKGYLNQKEIQEMTDSGLVEVGSHTMDHAYLGKAPLSFVTKQVTDSKKKLEETFGITVETFAYPYGSFSKDVLEIVKNAGYTASVSVIPGIYQSQENLFYLSRVRAGFFYGTKPSKVLEMIKN